MASIVESVVSSFVNKLGDQLSQNADSFLGVRDQVEWVESQFRWAQAFLKDAEAKSDKDERVKQWMWEVRSLAHLAEDIIDTFLVKIAPSMQLSLSGGFARINARSKLVSEIEKMKNKIHSISESRVAYGIEDIRREEGTSAAGESCRSDRRLLSPYVEEPDFVGFQTDQQKLIRQLTEGEQRRSVISIVGMGGQGKTTLARKLYQSDAVKGHFHPCLWISVSQAYRVTDLLEAIMKKCMGTFSENMDAFELRHGIAQHLKGKRYLVVLDDVWTRQAWDDLKDAFPNTSNGSRVLLTTRNEDVALHADPMSKPHELKFLNEDESWELFLKKAFLGLEANFPIDSQQLRKEILSKCQGLPLAIVVIGGLLSRRNEPREWQNILNSIGWQLIEGEDRISGILCLSYRDLPYHLKPCFLYVGIFPEDDEIPAQKLIRLWAAEGFLQERGVLTLEEVGQEFLRELIRRSLIQAAARSSSGAIKSCRIHDLLRDFILSDAKEDAFLEVQSLDAASKPCKGRRIAVHHCQRYAFLNRSPSNLSWRFDFLNHSPSNLRSLFILHRATPSVLSCTEMLVNRSFKLLRVLDISSVVLPHLPSEIGELIHLRYLGCGVGPGSLPTSIGNLVNLQTLCMLFFTPRRIPIVVLEMKQLRHVLLKSGGWTEIEGRPCVEQLWSNSNLRTLKNVVAGEWMNDGFLDRLTKLRKLGIKIKPMIRRGSAETVWKWIMGLKSLESLYVSALLWEGSLGQVPALNHLPKLCRLKLEGKLEEASVLCELPRNLTKLTLAGSRLEQDPIPILEKLENLVILKLIDEAYIGETMACTAGGFPRLQYLLLHGLNKLSEWRVEKGSMPCLTHLCIDLCWDIEELPEGLQHVTSLETLDLTMHYYFIRRVRRGERIGTKFNTYRRGERIGTKFSTYRPLPATL